MKNVQSKSNHFFFRIAVTLIYNFTNQEIFENVQPMWTIRYFNQERESERELARANKGS